MIRLVRGTGESMSAHMLSGLGHPTLDNVSEIRPIGMRTFAQSCASIRDKLIRAGAAAGPEGLWVVGYSLGSAGAVLAAGAVPNLRGLILLGNPFAWGTPMRYGIAGRIGLGNLGIPVVDLTVKGDPIADCHRDDAARHLAITVTGRPQRAPAVDILAAWGSLRNYLDPNGAHVRYGVEGHVDRAGELLRSWGAK